MDHARVECCQPVVFAFLNSIAYCGGSFRKPFSRGQRNAKVVPSCRGATVELSENVRGSIAVALIMERYPLSEQAFIDAGRLGSGPLRRRRGVLFEQIQQRQCA